MRDAWLFIAQQRVYLDADPIETLFDPASFPLLHVCFGLSKEFANDNQQKRYLSLPEDGSSLFPVLRLSDPLPVAKPSFEVSVDVANILEAIGRRTTLNLYLPFDTWRCNDASLVT